MNRVDDVGLLCPNYTQLLMEGVWSQYMNKERTDIVISFNDFEVKVHQMMVAIFAPKLLEIYDGFKCDLSGINIDQHVVSNIFEFIYRGRVSVSKENLDSVKKVAEELDVKPLLDSIESYSSVSMDGVSTLETDETCVTPVEAPVSRPKRRRNDQVTYKVGSGVSTRSSKAVPTQYNEVETCEMTAEESSDGDSNGEVVPKRRRGPPKDRLVVKCPHCEFETTSQKRFLRHLSTQHQVNIKKRLKIRFRCVDCEFVCDLRSQLKAHRKAEHSRKRMRKCPECDFSSGQKRLLDRHIQNAHSTDRPFPCKQCDYRAKCSADLYAHHTTHRGEKFECHICSTFISSKKNFNKHMKVHENPEIHKQPHRCHLCSFRSWTKTLLSKHMKRVHNCDLPTTQEPKPKVVIPDEGWQCSRCEYKTKEHHRWTDHLAVKHQVDAEGNKLEPSISCQHCMYTCYVQSQIRRHMVLSHSNKRFQCGYCDYASYNKTQVTYHVKAKHFSEKPFMCETCGMRFVTDCLLRRHVLTHGEEKFMCEVCKKTFALQSYLRKHMRHMHDKFAKKHMCHMCAFVTKTKDALNQHMKRMHKEVNETVLEEPIANPAIIVEEIPM